MHRTAIRAAVLGGVTACGIALAATPVAAKSSIPTLTIAMGKNSIKVGGQLVSGAVDIATTVRGEPVDHPALVHLKPGVTAAELGKFVAHLSQNGAFDGIDAYGTIVYDGPDSPAGVVTHAEADLPAGNYVALGDGNGHAIFTIQRSAVPAKLPTPQTTVTTIDFGFRGAATLHDGELVRFKNDGFMIHMVQAAEVASPATAAQAEADLKAGNLAAAKPLAVAPVAMWSGPLSAGANEQYVFDARPGIYVVFCSMNTQDGREHYELGMVRTITVVK